MLNRANITGPVTENSPRCVVLETTNCSPNVDSSQASLGQIAQFVNPYCIWRKAPLQQAAKFLIPFLSTVNITMISNDFTIGPQDNEHPHAVNCCVLYRLCLDMGLSMDSNTTIEAMAKAVKYFMLPPEVLRNSCIESMNSFTQLDYIRFLANSEIRITPGSTDPPGDLNVSYSNFNDISTLQRSVRPSSVTSALTAAAIVHKLDLSSTQYPLNEYARLRICGSLRYVPEDKVYQRIYRENNKYYFINFTFKPLYPAVYYQDDINTLMISYGLDVVGNINDKYEALLMESTTNTFYHGPVPGCYNGVTDIDCIPIEQVPYGRLFVYGVMDADVKAITIDELTRSLEVTSNFMSPLYPDVMYSKSAVNKLVYMLRQGISLGEGPSFAPLSNETIELYQQCLTQVERVREYLADGPVFRNFVEVNKHNPIVGTLLQQLLHIGMYMRGWDGPSSNKPYPLVASDTVSPPSKTIMIDCLVSKAMSAFYTTALELPAIRQLPLYMYNKGKFIKSGESRFGLTIGDRLDIVNSAETPQSCIRISSCWILASVYKYHIALGLPAPFDINAMAQIS